MKIYTTVNPNDFKEFFGDEYSIEEQRFTDKKRFKKYQIEQYLDQEIFDDDVFLLVPNFSQVCLVNLLKMDKLNPTYITMYKDIKPTDPFFKGVGVVCHVNEIDFALFNSIEKVQKLNKVYSPVFDLLESAFCGDVFLENQDQKKTLDNIESNLTIPFSSLNNQDYVPIEYYKLTGTDRGIIEKINDDIDKYKTKHNIVFFKHKGKKYYCIFTIEKNYFFIDNSSKDGIDKDIVEILANKCIDSLVIIAKESEPTNNITLKIDKLEKELEKIKLERYKISTDTDFYLKIETKNEYTKEMESFLPIPISNEKIYRDFYFFIDNALKQRRLQSGISDIWETKISITIEKQKEEHVDLYSRYSLYFLSQYNNAINRIFDEADKNKYKLHENIKSTLVNVIPKITYKKSKSIGTTIIYNFLEAANSDIIKNYDAKFKKKDDDDEKKPEISQRKDLFSFLNKHKDDLRYFFESLEDDDIKKYIRIINSSLTRSTKFIDSEFIQIRNEKIKIQKKILSKENKCLSDKYKKLIQTNFMRKKFQAFDLYLDPQSELTIYYDLNVKCQKIIDKYFNIQSFNIVEEPSVLDENNDLINSEEVINFNLENPIESIIEILNYLNKGAKKIDKTNILPLLNESIKNFLQSYQDFDNSRIYNYLDIKKYFQVFFMYIETQLGAINNKHIEITNTKNKIRDMFLILSNISNKTVDVLGEEKFNDWLKKTLLRVIVFKLIDFIEQDSDDFDYQKYNVSEKDKDSGLLEKEKQRWKDIEKKLFDNSISKNNYESCKETLPKNNDDRRLDQKKSALSVKIYLQTIFDVYNINSNDNSIVLVKKLDKLEKELSQKDKHKLFKHFLTGNPGNEVKVMFLDKVVIEPNKHLLGIV
jgi:hypothetical protein